MRRNIVVLSRGTHGLYVVDVLRISKAKTIVILLAWPIHSLSTEEARNKHGLGLVGPR